MCIPNPHRLESSIACRLIGLIPLTDDLQDLFAILLDLKLSSAELSSAQNSATCGSMRCLSVEEFWALLGVTEAGA